MFLSFLLFFCFYLLLPKNKFFFWFFLFASLIFGFFSLFFIVGNYYTGVGVDESVLYHMLVGLDGAGVGADLKVFFLSFSFLFFEIFLLILALYFWKKIKNFDKKYLSFLFLILAFLSHPLIKNFYEMGYFSFEDEKNNISYEIPEVKKKSKETKNFIYIYLESFENLYLDENIFPGVAKNLQNLKQNSTYFENVEQAFGTSWTIAGMVGSQCGTPLINSGGGGNSMHGISDFLPGAFCIGDYLKKAGYELSYVGGADLTFAGKGNFYKTHSFQNISGKRELEKNLKDKTYQNEWGFYDDTLFDLVFDEYERLSETGKNFGLFTLTLDTHGNDKILSKSCKKKNFKKEMLNSFACTDFLLGKFLEKIQNHKNFKNTVIVISSDHYAMKQNETSDILEKNGEKRRNLFLIINGEKKKIEKKGTTLDIGATILDKIGFDVKKLGYGVSLFSDFDSIENSILRKNKKSFEKFWVYPSIKNGIDFDFENKKVFINGKNIGFPAVLTLNSEKDTEKIIWEDIVNGKLTDKIDKNTIYFSFYTNGKFCLDFGKKSKKCFTKTGKITYEEILAEFE